MLSWGELLVMGVLAIILAVWMMLPLVPAVLIYRLVPPERTEVTGPIAGMAVKATGAFAAYLIIFLVVMPLVYRAYEFAGSLLRPAWTIKGSLLLVDKEGKPWHPGETFTQSIHVRTMPVTTDFQDVTMTTDQNAKGSFVFTVPEMSQEFPTIFVRTIHGQALVEMELQDIDKFKKTAVMKKPIRINEPAINNSDDRRAQTVPPKN
jgi:hypothetical protein